MIINHNISALNTLNRLNKNNKNIASRTEKLSSGLRINKAGDDSAGLAISEKMRAQIRGLQQAQRNIQDGISLIQIAEGGLSTIQDPNLQRLRELAIQASNGTLTQEDRLAIQAEVKQLKDEINRIANTTEFNGIHLLHSRNETIQHSYELVEASMTWSAANTYAISQGGYLATITSAEELADVSNLIASGQKSSYWLGGTDEIIEGQWKWVTGEDFNFSNWNAGEPNNWGGNEDYLELLKSNGKWNDLPGSSQLGAVIEKEHLLVNTDNLQLQVGANSNGIFTIQLVDARTTALGIDNIDLSTIQGAESALSKIDKAIEIVSSERGKFGAHQNALEHIYNNVSNYELNLTASESRIRDADLARQMMEMTKDQILSQASQAMLSQASQQPQQVLQLLR